MRYPLLFATLALLASVQHVHGSSRPVKRHYDTHTYYVLEHDPSAGVPLEEIASVLGAEVVDAAGELPNHWLLRTQKEALAPRRGAADEVLEFLRRKRARLSAREEGNADRARMLSAIRGLTLQVPRQRLKRAVIPRQEANADGTATSGERTLARSIAERLGILDPLFPDQWHLINEEHPEHMVNAAPVWDMGIFGEGVISGLVDDGLEYESEDLSANFDAEGSYDFNDHLDLPKPRLSDDYHGTRCAGQIAAVRNGVCGVGIAYKSKVAGLRILSGPISDIDEAAALNYGYQNTSIYSCSWGPADDGMSMDAPNYLIRKSFLNGVQNGRQGKGSVFVFASGNGAYAGDQCNFDGYTNSIYSVTVGAIDFAGNLPYYSEPCAANMVVSYSSGNNPRKSIVTTDMGKNACANSHGGTSAAAPNAVGVFALALSSRPDLSWRDIQHLCVQSAQTVNPKDPDWEQTSTGRLYNYKFGFGKLDAYAFVTAAQSWQLVKPHAWVETSPVQLDGGTMDGEGNMDGGELIVPGGVKSKMTITQEALQRNNFDTLEHITVTVWISHSVRGHVEVEIMSPNGIRSVLAGARKRDNEKTGFRGWTFMSIKHWGENPVGEWTIRVSDQQDENEIGHFLGWSMTLWGAAIDAEKAKPYVLVDTDEMPFPPPLDPESGTSASAAETETASPSATKSFQKPTLVPSASAVTPTTPTSALPASTQSQPSSTPAGEVGSTGGFEYISDNKVTFGIGSFFVLVAISGALIYFIRRRLRRRRQGEYARVPDGEIMNTVPAENAASISRSRQEVLFDADEETGLMQENETQMEEITVPPRPPHSKVVTDSPHLGLADRLSEPPNSSHLDQDLDK